MPEPISAQAVEAIISPYKGRRGVLLEVFHKVQEHFGYIPREAMEPIANALNMHPSTVFGSLTFYTELRTTPPPKVEVHMCLGPTCHVNNADTIRDILKHRLGLEHGHSSADGSCGIHIIQCAGHCEHAPLIYVNGTPKLNVKVSDAAALADEVRALANG